MVTKDFGLVSGLFLAAKGPERDRFGKKCPFVAPKGPIEG